MIADDWRYVKLKIDTYIQLSQTMASRPVVAKKAAPLPTSPNQQRSARVSNIPTVETVLRSIQIPKDQKMSKLSDTEVRDLASIAYSDGKPVLSLSSPNVMYQLMGVHVLLGHEVFMSIISDLLTNSIAGEDLVFESPTFKAQKNKYLADIDRHKKAITVVQGQDPCPKCHSMSTSTVKVQTRSADEPIDTLVYCYACKKKSKL